VGERFVGLVAEDLAQSGDRGVDLGNPCRSDGTERESGDNGRWFLASEPVEKAARIVSGTWIVVVSPASRELRMATVK
jgi:hypothetical protein